MPTSPENIKMKTHADDSNAMSKGTSQEILTLPTYLAKVTNWFKKHNLEISPT